PSWSLLETGQHLQIKGNVEFDRYTLHSYDYLNFFPLYVAGALGTRIDMPAVEVLDSLGVPLITDAYAHDERYMTFSLFLRGPRYSTLQDSLQNRFRKSPKELFDEWTMGFELRSALTDQLVREMLQKLDNPKLKYLDLYLADFDHVAHHNNDLESQVAVLKQMDAVIGEVWTAIQKTPLADETALVLVSDHGFNSDPRIYSQGYNLVKLLGSRAGGGHHVITKRRLMLDYAIKGVNPLVPLITTTTRDSYYLQGQSSDYPTAMLDFDGNERASIHLRDSDLNILHLILQQLQRSDLPPATRQAVIKAFFSTLDRRRPEWQTTLNQLNEELGALRRRIEEQRKLVQAQPKKFTREEQQAGLDDASKRVFVQWDRWVGQEKEYSTYAGTLQNLLNLTPDALNSPKLRISDFIARDSMGDRNSIYELQNYVVGLSPAGLVVGENGQLDMESSFVRIDYLKLLQNVAVRNNVQPGINNRPVDIITTSISSKSIVPVIDDSRISEDVVWVTSGTDKQALILSRTDEKGQLMLRYQPIRNLTQDQDGRVRFELIEWQPGLPLHIFEDPNVNIPDGVEKLSWLRQWHTDLEWLRALHRALYSNGLVGLNEELTRHPIERLSLDEKGLAADEMLMRRLAHRQRDIVVPDMLVVANNHWNFDVRGFNPGGNHGSFFRISTHSVLMVAGGAKTNIPRAMEVTEPYDSLSFVPTLLALRGDLRDDSNPVPVLWDRGFRRFPGRLIKELLPANQDKSTIVTGASGSP
ncbi:MAG TPA: alkaline phosphatase family protein, partial [Pyrinomonadaceae bacterium]|nr:alkaline phosphatase family protein [Pyrinomonadaceae bacterium]